MAIRNKIRAVVYVLSFIYYLIPHSVLTDGIWMLESHNCMQYIATFLILGVSVSAVQTRLVPKFLRPITLLVTWIPDRVEREVLCAESGSLFFGFFRVIQIFLIIIINKLMVKWLLIKLVSLLIFVLFKSTTITIDIVKNLILIGENVPVILILLLPVIKRGAWYYIVAYFAICGGLTLVIGIGYFSLTMMIWRKFVNAELTHFFSI